MYYDIFSSMFGDMLVAGEGESLGVLDFQQGNRPHAIRPGWRRDKVLFRSAREQVLAYLHGDLREFSVPVAPRGTDFQQQVWQALQAIPYGATASYRDIASRIGRPQAVRAVGAANGANPVALIIPCHRVIGSNGSLTGYAGGIDVKRRLLAMEQGA